MAKKQIKVAVLQVRALRPSFRRAGFQFGPEPTNIPLAQLTKDQVKAIKDEKMLVAVETEIDVDTGEADAA
jgi:hypothetical protein